MRAVYAVAYVSTRENGVLVHWHAWAAWAWSPTCADEPAGKPWTTPAKTGRVRQSWPDRCSGTSEQEAEIEADEYLRTCWCAKETARIDDSFAKAAFREAKGAAPNWRPGRPKKMWYAKSRGFRRPPGESAREFFHAEPQRPPPRARPDRHAPIAATALETLGLATGATAAEIRRAYRRLALQHHPDRGGDAVMFRRVTAAKDAALAAARG